MDLFEIQLFSFTFIGETNQAFSTNPVLVPQGDYPLGKP